MPSDANPRSLEPAPSSVVAGEDLAALATAVQLVDDIHLNTYAASGDEMLAHHVGSFGGPLSRGQCAIQTDYAIDVWVKRANLASAGTRNYEVLGSAMVCAP